MEHDKNFSYDTADAEGYKARDFLELNRLTEKYHHSGNGKTYRLMVLQWNGETDLWGFVMRSEDGAPDVWRPLRHLEGRRPNGQLRYIKA